MNFIEKGKEKEREKERERERERKREKERERERERKKEKSVAKLSPSSMVVYNSQYFFLLGLDLYYLPPLLSSGLYHHLVFFQGG